jgi:hypothetical protein
MTRHIFQTNDGVTADDRLPNALFASRALYDEFAPERRAYEAAVATHAAEIEPAAIKLAVQIMRSRGFAATAKSARADADNMLRIDMLALGYGEDDVRWHVANPGRREAAVYVDDPCWFGPSWSMGCEPVERGGWRGNYSKRKARA